MLKFRKMIGAGAMLLAAASCVTEPPALTADALLRTPYVSNATSTFDARAFFDALPGALDASYAQAVFDPASGAMVVDDLIIALRDAPSYRLRIDRAEIWGGDVDALAAIVDGRAVGERMTVFQRAVFGGVRAEGLQWDGGAQSAAFNVDRVAYDGLSARSIDVEPADRVGQGAPLLQMLAAGAGAYALNGGAYENLSLRMNSHQGAEIAVEIAEGFLRGYDGGRTDYERVSGVVMKTRTAGPDAWVREVAARAGVDEDGAARARPEDKILQPGVRAQLREALKNPIEFIAASAGGALNERHIDVIEVRGSDISGALAWLAQWRLPPITETELLDFGVSTVLGDRQYIDGVLIAAVERTDVSAFDFHWLVPSNFDMRQVGYTLNALDGLDALVASGIGALPETGSREIRQVRDAIVAMGLETIELDADFNWRWDGETGAASTDYRYDAAGLADTAFALDMGSPSLAAWSDIVGSERGEQEIIKFLSLKRMGLHLQDDTLLDRIFNYAAAEANATPDDLRMMMQMGLRASAANAAEAEPRIAAFADAIAAFIGEGGRIDVSIEPPAPITIHELQSALSAAPQSAPEVLNMQVVHTPK